MIFLDNETGSIYEILVAGFHKEGQLKEKRAFSVNRIVIMGKDTPPDIRYSELALRLSFIGFL